MACLAPLLGRLAPVRAQQSVGLLNQSRQGLVRFGPAPVDVLGHLGIAIQVVQLGP